MARLTVQKLPARTLIACLCAVAGSAPAGGCPAGAESCSAQTKPVTEHLLVQRRHMLSKTQGQNATQKHDAAAPTYDAEEAEARAKHHGRRVESSHASDCTGRFGRGSTYPAACLVVRGNQVLMVKVPYGARPGWDFPGGQAHHGEAPCQTAEREACEETGYGVRAVGQLQSNVFQCVIEEEGACVKPVDEGFLQKRWFSRREIGELVMRKDGRAWGDMRAIIRQHLSLQQTESEEKQ